MFLEIHDLKKSFGSGNNRTEVLKGIEFTANKGEICVLLGPSGSGKSTLLNIIGGIDSPDDGYVAIEGEKMKDMTEKALTRYRRRHLGYIFQMYNLIPNLNVKEYMDLGDIPVLSYILSDASLAEFDLKGESVFYLDDDAAIVRGAKEALIGIGILNV